MPYKPDVIDLADDDDDDSDEAEYDSIPLPDDIEAIENTAGPSSYLNGGRGDSTGGDQDGIDTRQDLKEDLAKLEAEVSSPSRRRLNYRSSLGSQARSLFFKSSSAS